MHWTHISDRLVGDVVVLDVRGHMTRAEPDSLLFGYVSRMLQDEAVRSFHPAA